MYNLILTDLQFSRDLKDLYYRLNFWKKLYSLSINQCQHILISVKDLNPTLSNMI